MKIIGVDTGIRGALALVDSEQGFIELEDMPIIPTESGGIKNTIFFGGLWVILCRWQNKYRGSLRAMIESPIAMPNQTVLTTASSFHTFSALCMGMTAADIPFATVPPAEWKRFYALKKVGKGSASDTAAKRAACDIARSMFPNAPISKASHDGRAEAILIANWSLRKICG